MTQLDLLSVIPECVLPGCRNKVDDLGRPCAECLDLTTALGPLLRPVNRPALTEAQIDQRDSEVRQAYADQAAIAVPRDDREWKANQRCWICEERRRCVRVLVVGEPRWECKACQGIA